MKTFLSQTELRWLWALKQGLGDPYKLHQWIWDTLPDAPDTKRDFLFRFDVLDHTLRILLLSERIPDNGNEVTWKTTEVSSSFLGHGTYRFQLRANPTFRRAADHRRLAIFDEEKIREWFMRKFSDAGCEVLSLETTAPRRLQFRKGNEQHLGTIYSVDASGVLIVNDEAAFRAAFDTGIGPAKGFGFGLLLLQPIQL
jgi:CRISPR-associated protein Cas6/Cse3/CasE, subtype I-E/ECOLI